MKTQEIREKFTKFFESKSHQKISSSPLIPQNDNTLLFANAGMNQFKDNFTGKNNPKSKRAVTIQKVVRAGGKHNDLENVGLTARHHTFFEMLGNFSFGDYFKKEAIEFAWEFLTQELKIPAEKLYITIHDSDDEALKIWNEEIGIPKDRIFKKGDKDNFWEMGDVGPCGPSSEIFYDHGEEHATPGFKVTKGGDILDDELRYVEIWNLVFMQYEKSTEGRSKLPKPSIDTGAGLERIAAVLQGKYWNYDIDGFEPILSKIESLTGKKYTDAKYTNSFRIVADHIRSTTMLITDGAIPSNEGRGYVLRRIIRRAVRSLKDLEAPKNSMAKLVPVVFETLGEEYPQNKANIDLAIKFLELEETKFLETLDLGLKYLEEAFQKNKGEKVFPGKAAFLLYDTYGFPLDLTEVILAERGVTVDVESFDQQMQKRKEDSKKSWKTAANVDNKVFYKAKESTGPTKFTGYEKTEDNAILMKIIDLGDELKGLIFDQTPFYAEGGGQAGDQGTINGQIKIFDTKKPVDDLFVHFCKSAEGLKEGEKVVLKIDSLKRQQTMRNHSATHLLQSALISVLGTHVKQAGSSVNHEKLRFDFTHVKPVSEKELDQVEQIINNQIQQSVQVNSSTMDMDSAIKAGALAFFGDKYGDEVRVIQMGEHSTELCGGTHVNNTSDIGIFAITMETSLSSGVRRIEATTSTGAYQFLKTRSNVLSEAEKLLKGKDEQIISKIQSLSKELKAKNKEILGLKSKLISNSDLFSNAELISDTTKFVLAEAPEGSDLRKISDKFVSEFTDGVLVLTSVKGEKVSVLVRSSKNTKVDCSKILKESLSVFDGRGGGKPQMAQGSGTYKDFDKFKTMVRDLTVNSLKEMQ